MKTIATPSSARMPRVLLMLVAFLLPMMVSAGVFYSPGSTVVANQGATITYYGSYGLNIGTYVPVEVKAPGSSTWTTIAYGVTGYYGSLSVHTSYAFPAVGTWQVRIGYDTLAVNATSG